MVKDQEPDSVSSFFSFPPATTLSTLLWPVKEKKNHSWPHLLVVYQKMYRAKNGRNLHMHAQYGPILQKRKKNKDIMGPYYVHACTGCHLILGSSIFDHTQRLRNEPRIGQPEVVSISWTINLWTLIISYSRDWFRK